MKFTSIKCSILFFALIFLAFSKPFQEEFYTVKSGETLSSIAQKFNIALADLKKWNPDAVKTLKAGQSIRILKIKGPRKNTSNEGPATHKVKAGESLSLIARKYNISIDNLKEWNNLKSNNVNAGADLVVRGDAVAGKPETEEVPAPEVKQESTKQVKKETSQVQEKEAEEMGTHKIASGETISAIARKYKMTVAELKTINNLKSNQIQLGQTLKVKNLVADLEKENQAEKAEPIKESFVKSPPAKEEKPKEETLKSEKESKTENQAATAQIAAPAQMAENGSTVSNTMGYVRVVETGFAEAIEEDNDSKKHLCLHRTAPVGSILQIKNEMNGTAVFVRVIGKLPDTGNNEKLIVRLSRRAFEKLVPFGKRFPVEVSYPAAQN